MQARLTKIADFLHASYWFIPSILSVAAAALAFLMPWLDALWQPKDPGVLLFLFFGEPQSARAILSTIAGSMMTVLSLTFSVTIVVLALASQQFGPRLLHSFLHDRGNQTVLGVFIGAFLYCLLTLRLVRDAEGASIPHLSIGAAMVLALIAVGALIYFINHLVHSIQASHVITEVSRDLQGIIRQHYDREGRTPFAPGAEQRLLDLMANDPARAICRREGVVQAVDTASLVDYARRHGLFVRALRAPGEFVFPGEALALAYSAERAPADLTDQVNKAFLLGSRRTLIQDVEFGFLQLVEIGLRALSRSLNDPFTAIAALDRMTAALAVIMERGEAPDSYTDKEGEIRLALPRDDFRRLMDIVFDQLRRHAGEHLVVLLHMLRLLARLAECPGSEIVREAIGQQAELVYQAAVRAADDDPIRRDIDAVMATLRARTACEAAPAPKTSVARGKR